VSDAPELPDHLARGIIDAFPGSVLLVEPDLRLCASPLCGGVWVRRVNHSTTGCLDGTLAARCYAARVAGVVPPLAGALVRGRLEPAGLDGFPRLAALRALASWRPVAASRAWRGALFRVRDTGLRCVTTPCFSLEARALESTRRVTLSSVGLSVLASQPAELARAQVALAREGVLVAGRVTVAPKAGPAGAGRELVVTQVWR